jgi:hypothetical protein
VSRGRSNACSPLLCGLTRTLGIPWWKRCRSVHLRIVGGYVFYPSTCAITLKWDMGILITKVTHGVCDPKDLRATTCCGNVLCLDSGLSNTRLFAGRPRHQRRTQKQASPRSGLPIQLTPGKIRIWKTMKRQRRRRGVPKAEVGVWCKYVKISFTACRCEVLGDAWKRAHKHTENWMSGLVAVK